MMTILLCLYVDSIFNNCVLVILKTYPYYFYTLTITCILMNSIIPRNCGFMLVLFGFILLILPASENGSNSIHVYSQTIPQGFQTTSLQMPNIEEIPQLPGGFQLPKQVEGKYINQEFGLEMTLAEGLTGIETSAPGSANVMVLFDDGLDQTLNSTEGLHTTTTFMVSMSDPSKMNSTNVTSPFISNNVTGSMEMQMNMTDMPKLDCKTLSSEVVNLAGKNAQVSVTECSMESSAGMIMTKTKNYDIQFESGKSVGVIYSTMSGDPSSTTSAYDTNLGKLEETIETIKFTN